MLKKDSVNVTTNVNKNLENDEDKTGVKQKEEEVDSNDEGKTQILDRVQACPAVFRSQQRGDPDLSLTEKRQIADDLLRDSPVKFLSKFGEYLEEQHLDYILSKNKDSYEVDFYVKTLKTVLSDHKRNIIKRNRRYEAMKRMEVTSSYFSEAEMEKREPLLYYQMVGQYMSEKEKMCKNREACKNVIPTFSNFLIDNIEKNELQELLTKQQQEEDSLKDVLSSDDESSCEPVQTKHLGKRWGDDWEDEQKNKKNEKSSFKKIKKNKLSAQEKHLLLQEFKSTMQNNFLSGKDDFNYSEIDSNPEYDCLELRSQDEEEKYFDDETNDNTVCTDTGIEDY